MSKPKSEEEIKQFCKDWDTSNHVDKVEMTTSYNVTFDTLKHWRSAFTSTVPILTRKQVTSSMTVTIPELLTMRPSVNLDFVCFDIETSNLKADFSIILTACIKPYGREPIVFRADNYPTWEKERSNDYQITKDIAEELRRHAIVITHYGMYFDVPYLRAKMTKHGLEPLPLMFAVDTWLIAKKNFQVSSRRLQTLTQFFDVGEKKAVEGELWMQAAYDGSKEAMDLVAVHNITDVKILEKLACISFPYIRSIPKL